MDLHIDDFYTDAARCLLSLYQSFPRKSTLYMDDFVGVLPRDEVGLPHPRQQQCLSSLLWLANEGYLRYQSTIGYDALDQVELTKKAFVRLCSTDHPFTAGIEPGLPPSVLRVQGSLLQQIRRHLRNQNSEELISVMQYFFADDD